MFCFCQWTVTLNRLHLNLHNKNEFWIIKRKSMKTKKACPDYVNYVFNEKDRPRDVEIIPDDITSECQIGILITRFTKNKLLHKLQISLWIAKDLFKCFMCRVFCHTLIFSPSWSDWGWAIWKLFLFAWIINNLRFCVYTTVLL